MLLARGGFAGLNGKLQVNVTRPEDAAARPGTVSTGDTAPFFAINQHTWAQIDDEARNPPESSQVYKDDLAITAMGIQPCTAASIDTKTNSCWGIDAFSWDGPGTGGIKQPGTFDLWGVPISVSNVQGGRFNKVFKPTPLQRRRIEVTLIRESQKAILGRHGVRMQGARPLIGEVSGPMIGGNSGSLATAIVIKARSQNKFLFNVPQSLLDDWAAKASVQAVMSVDPDIALYWINFERNPIQPTALEMTAEGGWASWINRGGYPLSRSLLTGQRTFQNNLALGAVAGPACTCPSNGAIVAPVAGINKNGIQFSDGKEASDSIIWDVYVSVYQDVNNPMFEISMFWEDKAWITKLGERAADFMGKLGQFLCSVAPVVQNQVTYSVSEKCFDVATKKPCSKGQANCKCVSPPSYVQADAAVFNAAMNAWCPAWQSQTTAQPGPQPMPQTPPPEVPAWAPPWWAVVGGGLLIGGALFARK